MGLMDVPGRRRRLLGRTKLAKPAPETWVRCYALFLRFQGLMCWRGRPQMRPGLFSQREGPVSEPGNSLVCPDGHV